MITIFFRNININYLLIFAFAIIYIVLFNNNSETDSYAFATSVKTGKNLLYPHHLIYCLPARSVILLLNQLGIYADALLILKNINGIAAVFCLFFLYKILKLNKSENTIQYIVFAGSCFGFARFATEGEAYILPIMFSLISTFYFLFFLIEKSKKFLLLSGLTFGISILFHQIHIFWFIGFFIVLFWGLKKIKTSLLFATPCVTLVLAFYYYASQNVGINFFKYIFYDYYSGSAKAAIGINNFLMTPISIVRTVFQVHGYIGFLIKKNILIIPISVALASLAMYFFYKIIITSKSLIKENKLFSNALLIAFVFQLLFAFFSVGNAEFMVMLPFLAAIWLDLKFKFKKSLLLYFSIIIFLWNLIFGLIPLHFLDIDGSKKLFSIAKNNKNKFWLFENRQKMENISEYYSDTILHAKIIRLDSVNSKSIKEKTEYIFTDYFNLNSNLNRRNFLFKNDSIYAKFSKYQRKAVDSIEFSLGKKYIYKVSLK